MISRYLLYCLLLVFTSASAHANTYDVIDDIDWYIEHGTTIVIVQCLPGDDDIIYRNAYHCKVRVLQTLQGELPMDEMIHVDVPEPLVPSGIYMIYSGEKVVRGVLNALAYRPAVVQVRLWGEIPQIEKDRRVADFLKDLQQLSLKNKLTYIVKTRLSAVASEQQQLEIEKQRLAGLLPK